MSVEQESKVSPMSLRFETLTDLEQAEQGALDLWQEAMGYEAAMLRHMFQAMNEFIQKTPPPESAIAVRTVKTWQEQLKDDHTTAQRLQQARSIERILLALRREVAVLNRLISTLEEHPLFGDPPMGTIIEKWRCDIIRERDLSESLIEAIETDIAA